ncbi:hypothetical protein SARC_09335, partial [Sphaeroforma arctica JP610]
VVRHKYHPAHVTLFDATIIEQCNKGATDHRTRQNEQGRPFRTTTTVPPVQGQGGNLSRQPPANIPATQTTGKHDQEEGIDPPPVATEMHIDAIITPDFHNEEHPARVTTPQGRDSVTGDN